MTIRELALKLGLSKTTVADALRDKSFVRKTTRLLVQERARQLGYTVNPVASAFLRQIRLRDAGSCGNLAVLFQQQAGNISGIQQKNLCRGIADRAKRLGYPTTFIDLQQCDPAKLTRLLLARGVLGLLLVPSDYPFGSLNVDWSKFSNISCGYHPTRLPFLHTIAHDYMQGIRKAFRECRRNGFRRIGLALKQESHIISNGAWVAGFLEIQRELPLSERVELFLTPDTDYTESRFHKWLAREKPDSVILRSYWDDTLDVCQLSARGVTPVVLDRLPNDPCAGIDQQYGTCGTEMVDTVSLAIVRSERGIPETPRTSLIQGKWVEKSTAPLVHRPGIPLLCPA